MTEATMGSSDGRVTVDSQNPPEPPTKAAKYHLSELFLSFLKLGAGAFGGPAMVAYIADLSVKQKKWVNQQTFKTGVALCQIIPGATAIQVAAFVGLQTRGVLGALLAFVGFGLPAFVFMAILSYLYVTAGNLPWIRALFSGLQVVVVALIANAAYTFGRQAVKGYADLLIAAASASALWFGVSPFYVILGAATAGLALSKKEQHPDEVGREYRTAPWSHIIALVAVIVGGIACLFVFRRDLFHLVLLMMKVDLFAFGGGFASVPLMLQEVVNVRGWMDSRVFMDGIPLGQVTPGPIVITATFVGYLMYGPLGAVAATIGIFTPSFVFVIVGTGLFNTLNRSAAFRKALKGIFASFVGLLFYVTIKFAVAVPWSTARAFIVFAALAALLRKIDILYIVLAAAFLGILLFR